MHQSIIYSTNKNETTYLPSVLRRLCNDFANRYKNIPCKFIVSPQIMSDYKNLIPDSLKETQNFNGDFIQFSPYTKMVEYNGFTDNEIKFE
jgi:hypothetical protein